MKYYDLSQKRPTEIKEYLCRLNHNGYIIYRVMWWTGCFVTAPGYTVTHWGEIPTVVQPNELYEALLNVYWYDTYKKAGEAMFLSANTVKYRIKKLEKILGTVLISTAGRRKVILTDDGLKALNQWQAENNTN
jgi:hypothetical protein